MYKLTKEQTLIAIAILFVFFIELTEVTAYSWLILVAIALILAARYFKE